MNILQSLAGMSNMTEQVIATDFLIAAKASVRNYAAALSEVTTPQVRAVLHRQLNVAIKTHEGITDYMIKKGFYRVYNPHKQINIDMKAANTVLDLHSKS